MKPTTRLVYAGTSARALRTTIALVFVLCLASLTACGPKIEAAKGEVGDQVTASIASGSASFDHSPFGSLLQAGVREGLVDYDVLEQRRSELDQYLESLARANLASLSGPHLKALLINAYNAYTIASILDHPDVSSIKDIDGVWSEATHPVGGFDLTLDNIEHNLLRPYFKDPRIHMAVNCASVSCAPLPPWAFDGDQIEDQLAQWTRAFFANPKYAEIAGDQLEVSKLLDWYGEDFTNPEFSPRADSLAQFIDTWGPSTIQSFVAENGSDPKISFKDYDWSLNRAP